MKRSVYAVAALFLAATVLHAEDAGHVTNEWFSITLPAGFAQFASQEQTSKAADGGDIKTTNWVSKAPTGEAVVVTVSRMPGKILDPEKLMASTRDSLIKSLNATLEAEEKVEGEMPATRLTFKSNSAAFLSSRLVVSEDRLYQVLYVGRSEEQRSAPATAQLFESFKVVAVPEAPATTTTTATTASAQ
jgi:hypothetical protein